MFRTFVVLRRFFFPSDPDKWPPAAADLRHQLLYFIDHVFAVRKFLPQILQTQLLFKVITVCVIFFDLIHRIRFFLRDIFLRIRWDKISLTHLSIIYLSLIPLSIIT